jgi:hypothetical protein
MQVSHHSSPPDACLIPIDIEYVTSGFKIKTRCSSYVCPRSSCHTYGQNVNTEKAMSLLYKIYYMEYCLYKKTISTLSSSGSGNSNPTSNRTMATQAFRRNLHHSSSSHLCLLSSLTARVSGLMVATLQVKEKNIII